MLDDFFFVLPPLLVFEPPPGVPAEPPMPPLALGIPNDFVGGGGGDAALGLVGLGSLGAGSLGSGWVVVPGIICGIGLKKWKKKKNGGWSPTEKAGGCFLF